MNARLAMVVGHLTLITCLILGFQNCAPTVDFATTDQVASAKAALPEPESTTAPELPTGALPETHEPDEAPVPQLAGICRISYDKLIPPHASPPKKNRCTQAGLGVVPVNPKGTVHVVSQYESDGRLHGLTPEGTSYRVEGQTEVVIHKGHDPIDLVVSSHEPTMWLLTGDVKRVRQVYALGYHCQSVFGVSASIVNQISYDSNEVAASLWGEADLVDTIYERIPNLRHFDINKVVSAYSSACHGSRFNIQ